MNVFEMLEVNGINVPNELRYYPYFIYYDFETWLKPNKQVSSSKLKYSGTQELLSISLIGSEESKAEFIPVEQTTEQALDQMMKKMNELRQKYLQKLYPKYSDFFGLISKLEDEKKGNYLSGLTYFLFMDSTVLRTTLTLSRSIYLEF